MIPFQLAALGTLALAAASFATPSNADAIPPGWEASHMEPVGYTDVAGRKGAFKMAVKKTSGKRLMLTRAVGGADLLALEELRLDVRPDGGETVITVTIAPRG